MLSNEVERVDDRLNDVTTHIIRYNVPISQLISSIVVFKDINLVKFLL